jgi:hypothetical protein
MADAGKQALLLSGNVCIFSQLKSNLAAQGLCEYNRFSEHLGLHFGLQFDRDFIGLARKVGSVTIPNAKSSFVVQCQSCGSAGC